MENDEPLDGHLIEMILEQLLPWPSYGHNTLSYEQERALRDIARRQNSYRDELEKLSPELIEKLAGSFTKMHSMAEFLDTFLEWSKRSAEGV